MKGQPNKGGKMDQPHVKYHNVVLALFSTNLSMPRAEE
jgi:hypothetical protein